MVQHHRLIPDPAALPYMIGHRALMAANRQSTHHVGSVRIPTGTGRDLVFGTHARDGANWVDDTGVQLPLVDTSGIEAAISRADSQITQITNSQSFANNTVKKIQDTVSGMQSTLTSTAKTANSALTDVAKVQADLKGFETAVSQTYLTKDDAAKTYTTSSQVEQTAKQISAQVVSNYKGADGSGLATQSSLDATKKDILAQVSQTYTTKDGVTQQLNSKVQQTATSLTTTFTNQLNGVKDSADDALSRVHTVASYIREDSRGILVGKTVNGEPTGYSALVNENGSFDVIDKTGDTYVSLQPLKFRLSTIHNGAGDCTLACDDGGMSLTYLSPSEAKNTTENHRYGITTGIAGTYLRTPDGAYMTIGVGGYTICNDAGMTVLVNNNGIYMHNGAGVGLWIDQNGIRFNDGKNDGMEINSNGISIHSRQSSQINAGGSGVLVTSGGGNGLRMNNTGFTLSWWRGGEYLSGGAGGRLHSSHDSRLK